MTKISILIILAATLLLTACDNAAIQNGETQPNQGEAAKTGIVENTKQVLESISTKSNQLSDIFAIQQAMQRAGATPDLQTIWQQKAAQAKTQADVKAILNEQLTVTQNIHNEMSKLTPTSQEGQQIVQKIDTAAQKMTTALQTMIALNLEDVNNVQNIAQATLQMQEGSNLMFGGLNEFVELLKSLGMENTEALEKYQKIQQQVTQSN